MTTANFSLLIERQGDVEDDDVLDEELDCNVTPCPMCGGEEIVVLGSLGDTTHCRCRACGWTFPV